MTPEQLQAIRERLQAFTPLHELNVYRLREYTEQIPSTMKLGDTDA